MSAGGGTGTKLWAACSLTGQRLPTPGGQLGGARRHGGVSSVQHRWSKVTRIMPGDREGDTEGGQRGDA